MHPKWHHGLQAPVRKPVTDTKQIDLYVYTNTYIDIHIYKYIHMYTYMLYNIYIYIYIYIYMSEYASIIHVNSLMDTHHTCYSVLDRSMSPGR